MKSKSVQAVRIPSLLLAAALQVLPIVRTALPAVQSAGNILAIIFRWSAAAAAALGGVNAVSGASTTITNPLNVTATNGIPFSLRLTTAPDQAHYWTATGLPNGLALTGISGQTLWKIEGTPTVTGNFSVGLTAKDQSTSGSSRTVTATLILNILAGVSPPKITTPPASLTVTQGQSANFSVLAGGSGTLSYQWRFNSANLSGQTAASLTLNSVTTANAGGYDVVVKNAGGSITSSVATLTVIVPPTPPSIVTQPTNQMVTAGEAAAFSVVASGSAPLRYQWRLEGNNLSNQTNAALVLNSVSTNQAGHYDVVVANNAGSVTSLLATLTVDLPAIAPAISSQPVAQTIIQGQTAVFDVLATGTAPLTYFWRKGTTVLSSSANSNFSIPNAQSSDAGFYSVVVSNAAGTATSDSVQLTVTPPPQVPFITADLTNRSVVLGSATTFAVTAGGTAPLGYQWFFGNAPVNNQSASSYLIANVQPANVGSYFVIVTNAYGSVTSSIASLNLIAPPVITTQPASVTNLVGTTAHFNVSASSTVPVGFQWRRSGTNLLNSAFLTGAQSNSLALANVRLSDAGDFSVVITNLAGAVTSQVAVLTVELPPVVLAPLTIQINGSGSVTPNYNGQMLAVGSNYTMTATPAAGFVFANWAGSLNASTPTLNFTMQSNLVLAANFSPVPKNLFTNGTYNGLFYEAAGFSTLSSGPFTAVTTSGGRYSGKLTLHGKKFSISGQFDSAGRATNTISRGSLSPLTIELALNAADPDELVGHIADGTWSADLIADRAVFSAANLTLLAGRYTFAIPGATNSTTSPAGSGYGTIVINSAGRVQLTGVLADGNKMTQSTALSKSGHWPLYVALYRGEGALLGWLDSSNIGSSDLAGRVNWSKGQQPADRLFPMGFSVESEVIGSRYTAPTRGNRVLDFTSGVLALANGNLPQPMLDQILLGTDNKIVVVNGPAAKLTISPATGLFKGSVVNPATGKPVPFSGALLQKQNRGFGYFPGNLQNGDVYFGP